MSGRYLEASLKFLTWAFGISSLGRTLTVFGVFSTAVAPSGPSDPIASTRYPRSTPPLAVTVTDSAAPASSSTISVRFAAGERTPTEITCNPLARTSTT